MEVGMKKLANIKPKLFQNLLIDIRDRIRSSQTSAVLAVNAEMLRLYWDIGRLIDLRQSAEGWGAAVIPRLATELKNELPELKGFSLSSRNCATGSGTIDTSCDFATVSGKKWKGKSAAGRCTFRN